MADYLIPTKEDKSGSACGVGGPECRERAGISVKSDAFAVRNVKLHTAIARHRRFFRREVYPLSVCSTAAHPVGGDVTPTSYCPSLRVEFQCWLETYFSREAEH